MSKKLTSPNPQPKSGASNSLFDRFESYLTPRSNKIFWIIFSLLTLLCFLNFDPRLTGANDDANYIQQGYKYAQDFTGYYYTSQAPLYPMFLALPISIFGINIILLKLTSLIFTLLFFYITYISLRGRVANMILLPVILISALNHYFLYFSSHTFVEAFYMVLQSVFFLIFFKATNAYEGSEGKIYRNWQLWLAAGFFCLLLILAKNSAYAVAPAFVIFFLIRKKYKTLLISLTTFILVFGTWTVVKKVVWGDLDSTSSQAKILFQKDPYNASKGNEDAKGFVARFFDNTLIYFSNRMMEILNLKAENESEISKGQTAMGYHLLSENNPDKMPIVVSTRITIILLLLVAYGAFWVIRNKQKELLFIFLYAACILGLSFIILQPFWAQHRYMYIFVPYFLLIVMYGLYCTFQYIKRLQFIIPIIYILLLLSGLSLIDSKIKKQGKILSSAFTLAGQQTSSIGPYKAYFKLSTSLFTGDKYAGYTPDWANYLKLSEWVSKNIPDSVNVTVRKPAEAFIYGNGRSFNGCFQVPSENADSVLAIFKRGHVKYAILAPLRLNIEKNDGQFINTLHRTLYPISQKYPGVLKLIRKEGDSEAAELYEINYN
jgi:hypothetical protein